MVNKGKRLTGINPLAYLGVEPLNPPQMDVYQRDPTPTDWQGYNLGSFWLNEVTEDLWLLVNLNNNVAKWILFATGFGTVTSLRADDGGLAVPLIGVVNVFGDGGAIVTRALTNPPHTLNITLNGTVATSYVEDVGVAVPAAGVLNVVGDGISIATTGAGNTITISALGDLATTYHTQAGNAAPAAGILNVFGDTGVLTTTGAGNTVTVNLTPSTNGQVIIGATAGNPAWANITSTGGTIGITNGPNTINLDLPPRSAFSAFTNTTNNNVTGDGTVYTIIFDSVVFDNLGDYNPATGTFTVPVTGLYAFTSNSALWNFGAAHNFGHIIININGGAAQGSSNLCNPAAIFETTSGTNKLEFQIVRYLPLTAGDTINIEVQVSGSTKTVNESIAAGVFASTFEGFFVRD